MKWRTRRALRAWWWDYWPPFLALGAFFAVLGWLVSLL